MIRHLAQVVLVLVTLAYPFLIYFGLGQWEPWIFVVLLAVIATLRMIVPGSQIGPRWIWLLIIGFLALWILVFEQPIALKAYPIMVSGFMLALFSLSLYRPPTVIERLARLGEPDLPPSGVIYTRKVTMVWCAFFIFNIAVSAYTALYASDEIWLLYNGMLSYLLIGLLFAGEWVVRQRARLHDA